MLDRPDDDDEWAMGCEREMLALKPGEVVERDGIVLFHTEHGMRGAMNASDWHSLMANPINPGPPIIDELGRLKGTRLP